MPDLRFAIRQLLKNPGFTAAAVLTLALGLGANTVVFGVAKAVLFRPLGFVEAERLMWIQLAHLQTGIVDDRLSWREIEDIREGTQSFEAVATFGSSGAIWERGDRTGPVPALQVTPNLGEILRVRPALGRMLLPSDATGSGEAVALIGYELWQAQFGGSPDVLGKSVVLDSKSRVIVGVLPPGLEFPLERALSSGTGGGNIPGVHSFWLPMKEPGGEDLTSRSARMYLPVARLRPGVTEEGARAELAELAQRLAVDHPETNRERTFGLLSFRDRILGQTRQGIPLLGAAVAAVLLICCVNLANLLLARGVTRQRELAVRLALGAGRRGIMSMLLAESALLALMGGGIGIVLAEAGLYGISKLASTSVPFIREASVDGPVFAFAAGLSLVTAVIFGWLPAWRLSRVDALESLRAGARTTDGPQVRVLQHGLLIGQIAAVLVLVVSAVLLLGSFRRLVGQDLGYRPGGVIALDLSQWGFPSNGDVCRLYRTLREQVAALPGVEAVGTVSSAPLTGKWTFDEKADVVGRSVPAVDRPSLAATFVAFDYFQAMGIPLVDGRYFRDAELKDDGYGQIVIINEAAANVLFPGRPALGGRFTVGSNPDRVLEVVGVVKDTRDVRLETTPQPRFYWQYAFGGAQLVVRSSVPVRALMPRLREIVQQADSRLILHGIRPMAEIVSGTVAERRLFMTMLTAYAALALGIAVVGIFGVVAYQVAQRTSEFGIRLTLGASPAGLTRLVMAQSLQIVGAGVASGVLLSLATSRLLVSHLYELSPHDPWMLGGVSLLVLGTSLAASAWPARRAARVDPMVALRNE